MIVEHYRSAPSALRFMARAPLPSPGMPSDGSFPRIVQRWSGLKIETDHVAAFRRATGLAEQDGVGILYPHVLGFRLQMALLTHRAYPLPIWRALQIRNRLVRHRRIDPGETLQLETQVGPHRIVEKGLEIDLLSRLTKGSDCCWESAVTYFYRGRFGAAEAATPRTRAPVLAEPTASQCFAIPRGGGLAFARLTGDYNGIHYWPWYARRFGFPTSFPHAQWVAGMCMARLQEPDCAAQSLELWIKGPVFYGSDVTLRISTIGAGVQFGLWLDADDRPALAGKWRAGPPD